MIDQKSDLRDLEPILNKKYHNVEITIVGAVFDIYAVKVAFLGEILLSVPRITSKPESKHNREKTQKKLNKNQK